MPRQYTTRDGDMLDAICYRYYDGRQAGAVEQVMEANFGQRLALSMPVLPPGLTITLPDLDSRLFVRPTQKLWD